MEALARYFLTEIKRTQDLSSLKAITKQLEYSKLGSDYLKEIMDDYKRLNKHPPQDINKILKADNLIIPGRFYYHPHLQVSQGPPTISLTDDGDFEEKYNSPHFFLRNVRIFTIENFNRYYLDKVNLPYAPLRAKSTANIFLEACMDNLDIALFTIDLAYFKMSNEGVRIQPTLMHLSDYVLEGSLIYEDKRSLMLERGLAHEF